MINKDTTMNFVYGTLKVGGYYAPIFDEYRKESVPAFIKGFEMYTNGHYPMIVKSENPEKKVFGEYHYYRDASFVIGEMDRIEGYDEEYDDGLYLRRKVTVFGMDGRLIGECWTYIYNREIEGYDELDGTFDHLNS